MKFFTIKYPTIYLKCLATLFFFGNVLLAWPGLASFFSQSATNFGKPVSICIRAVSICSRLVPNSGGAIKKIIHVALSSALEDITKKLKVAKLINTKNPILYALYSLIILNFFNTFLALLKLDTL